jgi:hypothetical protein
MESVDLDSLDVFEPKKTVSFGNNSGLDSGIELLMNEKKINKSLSTGFDDKFGNLVDLNKELQNNANEVYSTSSVPEANTKTISGGGWFDNWLGPSSTNQPTTTPNQTESNVGQATVESLGTTKTWDGFTKINEPVQQRPTLITSLSERDRKRKKRMMIRYLEKWVEEGKIKNQQLYNLETTPYEDIEDEYEAVREDDKREDAVKGQGMALKYLMHGLETGNQMLGNPVGLELNGLGKAIESNLDIFTPDFYEIYDLYLKNMPIGPVTSLALKVGMITLSATGFKQFEKAFPALGSIINSSPEIRQAIIRQGLELGKSDYGREFMEMDQQYAPKPSMSYGPPPPIESSIRQKPYANRPDLAEARPINEVQSMFANRDRSGIELNGYAPASSSQAQLPSLGKMNFTTDIPPHQKPRAEMKGPSPEMEDFLSTTMSQKSQGPPSVGQAGPSVELDDFFAGLKPKYEQPAPKTASFQGFQSPAPKSQEIRDDESVFSNDSIRNIGNARLPKSSTKRRNRSDKNVVSLDL